MPSPSAERALLTYPNPGVTRLCIFGSIALVTYVSIRLVDAWPKHHGPQIAAWTSWWPMVSICTLLFSLALTVLEGLFVLGQKWDAMKLEFDADNFYITVPQGERTIPLQEITSFRLIYGKRLVDNSRLLYTGMRSVLEIERMRKRSPSPSSERPHITFQISFPW